MTHKIFNIATLLFLVIFVTGCFNDTCGLFGSGTSWNDEFVVDRPFDSISVAKGDTTILRPETYLHINYTYTGGPNCGGEDYQDGPSYVRPIVLDDSIASAKEYYDNDSEPLWRGTEMKVRIIGKEVGHTILELQVEWYTLGREDVINYRDFEIELTVIEANE